MPKKGYKYNQEYKDKCRKRMLGNQCAKGLKHTEDSKKKIGLASKGKIVSENTKEKMRQRIGEKSGNWKYII